MTAYLYSLPAGIAGDVTRQDESNVEPIQLGSPAATKYGVPLKYSAGKAIPFAGGEVAADFQGVLTRIVPAISGSNTQGYSDDIPNPDSNQGILVRGYINVLCKVGTPARGGIVYVRIVDADPKFIGDFEATSDSTNSIALTNVSWASNGKDANNNAEIRVAK